MTCVAQKRLCLSSLLGSLSSHVFEPRTSTRSELFAVLSRQFERIFGQILSMTVKLRSNTILVPWRYIKRGTGSLPVDVRRSRTSLFKPPNESNTRRSNLVRKAHSICFDWMVTSQDFLLAHYFLTGFFLFFILEYLPLASIYNISAPKRYGSGFSVWNRLGDAWTYFSLGVAGCMPNT